MELDREQDAIDRYKQRSLGSSSPLKAIRAHCVECMGGGLKEIVVCTYKECALFDFRMGKNPRIRSKSKGNIEHLKRWQVAQSHN